MKIVKKPRTKTKKKTFRHFRFSRKLAWILATALFLLAVTTAYAAYDISRGGWIASHFGQLTGINLISAKKQKDPTDEEKKAARAARETQIKKDNLAKQQTQQKGTPKPTSIQQSTTPTGGSGGCSCGASGHKRRSVEGKCDAATGKKYVYTVDDSCGGCYVSGTSKYIVCSTVDTSCKSCGAVGHKTHVVTKACDASGKQYYYTVDDSCGGCYVSGTSGFSRCTPSTTP